ncbi:MAG UNVERIFIED_CONTAM: hypothetical protein LVR18_40115 [Planctomycetaceae bacterium]
MFTRQVESSMMKLTGIRRRGNSTFTDASCTGRWPRRSVAANASRHAASRRQRRPLARNARRLMNQHSKTPSL